MVQKDGLSLVAAVMSPCVVRMRARNEITSVDAGVVTDLSGRWNDTDSRMVAESMVKEALEYPWLDNFSSRNGASRSSSSEPFRTAATNISTSNLCHRS